MPLTARELLADGYTYNEIARGARRGDLVRVRRGAYLRAAEVGAEAADRHRQLVEATLPLLHRDAVVSRQSAAVLQRALSAAQGRRGVAAARRAVALLDGRSESAGESASRVVLHEVGLPPSDLQLEVLDDGGRMVGRCDFGWQEHRTVGEFDGRVKYGRLLKPGQASEDVVYAEKRREDALRDQGWQVVRWSWPDLLQPHLLVVARGASSWRRREKTRVLRGTRVWSCSWVSG
jgi:hypothetical protein